MAKTKTNFSLDELFQYRDEEGILKYEETHYFNENKPVCGHCGKEANHGGHNIGLHHSILATKCSSVDHPNMILAGTNTFNSILCIDCWPEMIDGISKYIKPEFEEEKNGT